MGHGLSPLQRYIVTKAATVERLYYHDILQEYYGWQSHRRPCHPWHGTSSPGTQRFWPAEIGKQRYHQTMVTLSRAVARLHTRGLVVWLSGVNAHWSGVEITLEGRSLAAAWQQPAPQHPGDQLPEKANG
jgi:hypothetical protein